jgi:hypothetical protein
MGRRHVLRRGFAVAAVSVAASACGATASPPIQVVKTTTPTYAQVIFAMSAAKSVHVIANTGIGEIGDLRTDTSGGVEGKITITGEGSVQVYARLVVTPSGGLTTSTFDAIPDAGFAAPFHLQPNVCVAFSPTMQKQLGLSASGLNAEFSGGGLASAISAAAPAMTLQGTSKVNGVVVNVFKEAGRELDVPIGLKLPIRYMRHATSSTDSATTLSLTEWNAVGAITKPASCP